MAESENTTKKAKVSDDDEGDEADNQAEAEAELLAEDKASAEWDEEMVPVPVDAGHLADLVDMGFSDIRARKGIYDEMGTIYCCSHNLLVVLNHI
jgi:hypothetical protein